jgi:hypothetical protein
MHVAVCLCLAISNGSCIGIVCSCIDCVMVYGRAEQQRCLLSTSWQPIFFTHTLVCYLSNVCPPLLFSPVELAVFGRGAGCWLPALQCTHSRKGLWQPSSLLCASMCCQPVVLSVLLAMWVWERWFVCLTHGLGRFVHLPSQAA